MTTSHTKLQKRIKELTDIVDATEDQIFRGFCRKVQVSHIREFEERQLKASQEESELRLRFDTQIARLNHQYVSPLIPDSSNWNVLFLPNRTKFEEDSLQALKDRLQTLSNTAKEHENTLSKLLASKKAVQEELDEDQAAIDEIREELKGFEKILEEKTTALDEVKRVAGKSSKALDKALKDIASKVLWITL